MLTLLCAALAVVPQEDHKLGDDITARFEVPDGLQVTVWAQSPQFFNPTNIDVDIRGRIWVAEAVNYRRFNTAKKQDPLYHEAGDRIMILEDTDGDGVCDASKVFVQDKDLLAPLGIAVIGNKVIVSCSPNVIVYTDEDGDDKPDRKEIFLTGFKGKDHDHGVHAFVGGPDGRWYFNCGNSGARGVKDASGNVFSTGRAKQGRSYIQGVALRIDPDGKNLTPLAHNFRNNYELTVDSFGHVWQNDNDDDGNRSCRITYVLEGGNYGYKSRDDRRSWRLDMPPWLDRKKVEDIQTAHWHLLDPGVVPPNHVTGAGAPTGIVVYEGDLLAGHRGAVLSCDAGRSTVWKAVPTGDDPFETRQGIFLGAIPKAVKNAQWFRPSDVAVGTDGAVYVSDWYDPGVGGHNMRELKGYGRILRITPKGKNPKAPKLQADSLEALKSPAINVRYRAAEAMVAAKSSKAAELAKGGPRMRARALWIAARIDPSAAVKALADKSPGVRIAAFRALRLLDHDVLKHAAALAKDPSPAVQREVAVALRDASLGESREILLELARRYDGKDRRFVEALGIGCEGKESEIYRALVGDQDPLKWSEPLAGVVWRLHPPEAVGALKARATSPALSPEARIQAVTALAFIAEESAAAAMAEIAKGGPADVKDRAAWWAKHLSRFDWKPFDVPGKLK